MDLQLNKSTLESQEAFAKPQLKQALYDVISIPSAYQQTPALISDLIGQIPLKKVERFMGMIPSTLSNVHVLQAEAQRSSQNNGVTAYTHVSKVQNTDIILEHLQASNASIDVIHTLQRYQMFTEDEFDKIQSTYGKTGLREFLYTQEPAIIYCYSVQNYSKRLYSVTYNTQMIDVIGLPTDIFSSAIVLFSKLPDPLVFSNNEQIFCDKWESLMELHPFQAPAQVITYEGLQLEGTACWSYLVQGNAQQYYFYEKITIQRLLKGLIRHHVRRLQDNALHFRINSLEEIVQKRVQHYQDLFKKYAIDEPEKEEEKNQEALTCSFRENPE